MKKAQVTKILVEGDRQLLQEMAKEVELKNDVKVEQRPTTGLVMMKARDSVSEQPFYIGEALVTECLASISGIFGFGVIKGEEAERAYQLAVVDAAFNAKLELVPRWYERLKTEERKIVQKQAQQCAASAKSTVQFDTMEDYYDKS